MHKLLVLALAGSSFILASASNSAQLLSPDTAPKTAAAGPEAPVPRTAAEAPAAATEIPPSGRPIQLEAGKGTLIRLPRPADLVLGQPLGLAAGKPAQDAVDRYMNDIDPRATGIKPYIGGTGGAAPAAAGSGGGGAGGGAGG